MSPEILASALRGISSAKGAGISLKRLFTKDGVHPYDEIFWDKRKAVIKNSKGEIIFEQKDVEEPNFWSGSATDIVTEKYFSAHVGRPRRATSGRLPGST